MAHVVEADWRVRLAELVMETWDPIGVSDFPEAGDEYDSYLGPVARRLREGASAEEIAKYLGTVRRDAMELSSDQAADLHAAKSIAEWYQLSTKSFVTLS